MSSLKRNINLFFFRNRDKGIPRLMLWVCIGNAIVFILSLFNSALPGLLYFDSGAIMGGEVWRLFSYILTFACRGSFFGSSILGAVFIILFYYWIGNTLESACGTFRFNMFYLSGVLITDIAGLVIHLLYPHQPVLIDAHSLNLSMYLAVATLIPESRIYISMILPVKMKWMAWIYLGITAYQVGSKLYRFISALFQIGSFLPWTVIAASILIALFPLLSLLNYFLFFGDKLKNLMPRWKRINIQKQSRREAQEKSAKAQPNPNWAKNYRSASGERPYRHKCTVCGRTDTDCPNLEFRYCSRCKGYFCYCIDHINNHSHVE